MPECKSCIHANGGKQGDKKSKVRARAQPQCRGKQNSADERKNVRSVAPAYKILEPVAKRRQEVLAVRRYVLLKISQVII